MAPTRRRPHAPFRSAAVSLTALLIAGCAGAGPDAAPPMPQPAAASSTAPAPDPREAVIDSMMAEWVGDDTPGAVLGVVRDGDVVWARGYGLANLAHGVPITTETRFNPGSVAKQFTAFALALLESRGELSIDDPVQAYLPEIPTFDDEVTLRHLLTHTSGLRETYGMGALAGIPPGESRYPREGALEVVRRQTEPEFPVGSRYQYNSSAYVLLAMVVERVTGESFPDWMAANVFEPLGMDRTLIEPHVEAVIPGAADSYVDAPGGSGGSRGYVTAFSNRAYWGAADVYTTIADMAKWLDNFGTGELGGMAVQERMRERFVLTTGDTSSYALGIVVDEHRGLDRISHSGGHAGYAAFVEYFPALNTGIVLMTNYPRIGSSALLERVEDLFFGEHIVDPEPTPGEAEDAEEPAEDEVEVEAEAWRPEAAELGEYTGRYLSPELETLYTLVVRDGWLRALHRWNPELALKPVEPDVFTGALSPHRVVFERDASGAVVGLWVSMGRTTRVWFERMDG